MAQSSNSQPPQQDRQAPSNRFSPNSRAWFLRPRVLSPELGKARSKTPSGSGSKGNADRASSVADLKPSLPHESFLSRFRNRYFALPSPVWRSFRVLRFLVPAVPIGAFFSEHVLQVMWVRGPSMTPYLNEDYAEMHTQSDMILVNMWPWASGWPWERRRRLERGMVITFRSPANPSHVAIKRVIALPGDCIKTREPCPKSSQIVPFNHVWLEGDAGNPRMSLDSNTYGPVSISLITGRVIAVLWPRMRLLKWWEWDRGDETDCGMKESRFEYGKSVRERVLKEAVKVEQPFLG